MKLFRLAALPALLLILALSRARGADPAPAAGAAPAPAPPAAPEQTLLSHKWLFVNIGGAKYEFIFHKDGTITCDGKAAGTWAMTGPASFQMNGAPGAAPSENVNFSDDLSKWVSTQKIKRRHRTGYILGSLDGSGGTQPPPANPGAIQPPPAHPGGTPLAGPGATPAPAGTPALVPADQRSQLANFYSQIPNTAAWVHAPLDVTVPPALFATLAAFKQGLAVESVPATADLRKAYIRAGVLVDELVRAATARTQCLRSQVAPGAVPPPAAMASWAIYDRSYRTSFLNARKILDEEARDGGGVGRAAAIAGSTLPMPGLPPAPASARSPDFDATPPYKRVFGSGPSFVNNPMLINVKLGISVATDSETPVNLVVDGYWIGGTRDSYKSTRIFHRPVTVGWRNGFNIDIPDKFRGTGHLPGAIVPELELPYAGWAITIHDSGGTRVGCASSQGIFDKYVP